MCVDFLVGIWVRLHTALVVFGMFGLFGVLVDLDHIVRVIQLGLPVNLENILSYGSRIFHFPILLVCGLTVCFLGACLGGLLFDAIANAMGCYKE
jgi:hypothetical protein